MKKFKGFLEEVRKLLPKSRLRPLLKSDKIEELKAFHSWYTARYEADLIVLNPREFAKEIFLATIKGVNNAKEKKNKRVLIPTSM